MHVSFVLLFVAVIVVPWVIADAHDRRKVKLRRQRQAARESRSKQEAWGMYK